MKILMLIGASCLSTRVLAQQYSIDWYTIDGGGGTSTNGQFAIAGTIGQPDAGQLTGGNYTIEGGFWGLIAALQTRGAPLLTIRLTATNSIAISWPSSANGFTLQQDTTGIATANWSNVTTSPIDDGTTKTVIINAPAGTHFYRLQN